MVSRPGSCACKVAKWVRFLNRRVTGKLQAVDRQVEVENDKWVRLVIFYFLIGASSLAVKIHWCQGVGPKNKIISCPNPNFFCSRFHSSFFPPFAVCLYHGCQVDPTPHAVGYLLPLLRSYLRVFAARTFPEILERQRTQRSHRNASSFVFSAFFAV